MNLETIQAVLGVDERTARVIFRESDRDGDGYASPQEVSDWIELHTEHPEGWEPAATVYIARDSEGAVLYVGITGRNIRRLHAHSKAAQWWPLASSVELEHQPSRAKAAARERQLIRDLGPRFNVVYSELVA